MNSHAQSVKRGSLEVICGSMFSGKSEELIRRLTRATYARQEVLVIKPRIDTRRGLEQVTSHSGDAIKAQALDSLAELGQTTATVIGIDEVQFFTVNTTSLILQLVEQGKRVIVAGLDLDFRGIPFGCMPSLMAVADHITKLKAICVICGSDAQFSQRLVNGNPARSTDPIVMIGAQEQYEARCRSCFVIDKAAFMHITQ